MKKFEVWVDVTMRDTVIVEAESADEALEIVNTEGFCYDDAVSYSHDVEPEISGVEAHEYSE